MNFSCHYHLVILLVIATVHYVILCDRVIPHALYVDSQPSYCVKGYIYINAQMVVIMNNDELLRLLMIYIEI